MSFSFESYDPGAQPLVELMDQGMAPGVTSQSLLSLLSHYINAQTVVLGEN